MRISLIADGTTADPGDVTTRWTAAIFYPDAKVKETFTISEKAQEVPKVQF